MLIQSIVGVICGGLALLLLIYCILMLCEKGPIFTNRFIWSSEAEKKTFDKKAGISSGEHRLRHSGVILRFRDDLCIYFRYADTDRRIFFDRPAFYLFIINAVKSQRKR